MVRNHQDGYPYLNLSNFFFWKLLETLIVLVSLIGQWIHGDEGRGITRDILKKHFYLQHFTKIGNKVGTIYKAEM